MHQRGPCVTLNIYMFLGCVPLFQRLLFGKAFPSLFGCVCWFSSAQEKQWEESVSLSLCIVFVSHTIICNLPSPHKSQGGNAD